MKHITVLRGCLLILAMMLSNLSFASHNDPGDLIFIREIIQVKHGVTYQNWINDIPSISAVVLDVEMGQGLQSHKGPIVNTIKVYDRTCKSNGYEVRFGRRLSQGINELRLNLPNGAACIRINTRDGKGSQIAIFLKQD